MSERVLIVDDDPSMCLAMAEVLVRTGLEVQRAGSAKEALAALAASPYGLVVTDLKMPGVSGHDLLRRVRTISPRTPVLVVTAHATVASAVSCVRDGAVDYLTKPFSPGALEAAVGLCLESREAKKPDDDDEEVIACDPAILLALDRATRAAVSDVTVLLEAESGAGKEIFAHLIHRQSGRKGRFVAVNCAALPRELLEAELFGHTRGAFTGAHRDRRGHFRVADGGTLFLDEIAEMNRELQARLLRVLQDRSIQPVGGDTPIRVDVRVIAATNRNLREEVAAGRFREDLYYRLNVLPVRIPPLRERPADIEPLARRFAKRYGGRQAGLTDAAMARLRRHFWPGNVRELQNVLQRAAIVARGPRFDVCDLELEPADGPLRDEADRPLSLDEAERVAIGETLMKTGGNRSSAAAALGISPRTLRHKLKRYRDQGRPVGEACG